MDGYGAYGHAKIFVKAWLHWHFALLFWDKSQFALLIPKTICFPESSLYW